MVKWEFFFAGEKIKFEKSRFYGYIFMSLSIAVAIDHEGRWGTCYLQSKNRPYQGLEVTKVCIRIGTLLHYNFFEFDAPVWNCMNEKITFTSSISV